jgi:hypothetical protein
MVEAFGGEFLSVIVHLFHPITNIFAPGVVVAPFHLKPAFL